MRWEKGGEEEDVSLILWGNWTLPTLHEGPPLMKGVAESNFPRVSEKAPPPPPIWEKFPNNPVIFFDAVPKHPVVGPKLNFFFFYFWQLSVLSRVGCVGQLVGPKQGSKSGATCVKPPKPHLNSCVKHLTLRLKRYSVIVLVVLSGHKIQIFLKQYHG